MRAIVCTELGTPDRLVIDDVPEPTPAEGEVLVDVVAAGVNFPDLLMIAGKYQATLEPPFIPGGEGAGVVAATGAGATRYDVGDPVIFTTAVDQPAIQGAFAEFAAVPERQLLPMPRSLSFEQAAGFPITYGTAYHALRQRAGLQPGERLLVLGAGGGVGAAAVDVGTALGAEVIAAAGSEEKLAFAAELGAAHTIDYRTDDVRARIRELTGGAGVDVVVDPVGGDVAEPAVRATGWGGRYLVIGFAAGEIPRIPLNLPLLKGSSIVGVYWGAWAMREPDASRQNFAELFTMADAGDIEPRVTAVYDIDDQQEAFRAIAERRAVGKTVIRFGKTTARSAD